MNSSPLEFRIWHKPTNSLHLVNSFRLDQGKVWIQLPDNATKIEQDYANDTPFKLEDCVMMQYTGRMDERGQKVWEGDVLRTDIIDSKERPDEAEEYSFYTYVVFHIGGFANFPVGREEPIEEQIRDLIRSELFYLTSYEGDCLAMQRVACMYEHPELLDLTRLYPLHPDAIRTPGGQSEVRPEPGE